ncbi:MAG: PqqD family peptide modification chaperone [Desulfobacterales bacterium]
MTEGKKIKSEKYAKNPDVVVREEDKDGVLLYNPDTDQILIFNTTAYFIWQVCDGTRTLTDIISAVKEHFDKVPEDEMEEQVAKYVSDMLTAGFIGIVEE